MSSLLYAILKSDLVIKVVLAVLLLLSILTCAILLQRIRDFRYMRLRMMAFQKRFWSGVTLEEFYEANKSRLSNPCGQVFALAMEEWIATDIARYRDVIDSTRFSFYQRLENATESAIIVLEKDFARHSSFVSMVTSIAPFIGLFGTVWGVIHCFSAMAFSSHATLSTLAPGISEALITTACGIVVSIFAVVTNTINESLADGARLESEKFRLDLLSVLSREIDSFSTIGSNGRKDRIAKK